MAGPTPADTGDAKPRGGSEPLPVEPVDHTRIDRGDQEGVVARP
ncbi:hypothetical protein ACVV2G_08820 [Streptomyces ziwulingensis]